MHTKMFVPQQKLLGLQADALPVNAVHAACACDWLSVPAALQSKKFWPTPSLCVVWQLAPQHAGVEHSHPSVFGADPALQSD